MRRTRVTRWRRNRSKAPDAPLLKAAKAVAVAFLFSSIFVDVKTSFAI